MINENRNQPIQGKSVLRLDYVHALKQNGSLDPTHCAACTNDFSQYKGMQVITQYSINTETLIMTAASTFAGGSKIEPIEITVELNALGISGQYAFGCFRPTHFPEAYAVLFSIDTEFNHAVSSFVLYGPKGQEYNCLFSSSEDPMNGLTIDHLKNH